MFRWDSIILSCIGGCFVVVQSLSCFISGDNLFYCCGLSNQAELKRFEFYLLAVFYEVVSSL